MDNTIDRKGHLRAAFTPMLLARARAWATGGLHEMLLRVVLATAFTFLVVLAHELMGAIGVIYVGALFMILIFVPMLWQLLGNRDRDREPGEAGKRAPERLIPETQPEG